MASIWVKPRQGREASEPVVVVLGSVFLASIPNAVGRSIATMSAAIRNLRDLNQALYEYHRSHGSYPNSLRADTFLDETLQDSWSSVEFKERVAYFSAHGALQTQDRFVSGYLLRYTPTPIGCAGSNCSGYVATAMPLQTSQWWGLKREWTGERSFYTDESGLIRHCVGSAGAEATDATIDQPPRPCRRD